MSIGENTINGVYHMVNGKIDIPTTWECQLKIRNVNGNVIMNFQDPLYLETKEHHEGDIGMGLEMVSRSKLFSYTVQPAQNIYPPVNWKR